MPSYALMLWECLHSSTELRALTFARSRTLWGNGGLLVMMSLLTLAMLSFAPWMKLVIVASASAAFSCEVSTVLGHCLSIL